MTSSAVFPTWAWIIRGSLTRYSPANSLAAFQLATSSYESEYTRRLVNRASEAECSALLAGQFTTPHVYSVV
jgi:hypothetical protein